MVCIREIKSLFHLFVARCMKTVAYLRISTGSQDLANQKLAILDYARQKRFAIDRFVEAQASSRKGRDQRRIEELLGTLAAGDRLVVSELSRLGRSLGQVIQIVDELVKRKVRFIAIKEAIRFEGKQDLQTKVMIALFGLFAEVERDLISERTKEGLAAAGPRAACSAARRVRWASPSSTARRGRSGCSWRRRSPRRRSPRSWAYRRPTSVTSSGPENSPQSRYRAEVGGAALKGSIAAIWLVS